MMQKVHIFVFAVLVAGHVASGVTMQELSPAAQAFVGDSKQIALVLKDGREVTGELVRETATHLEIRMERGAGIRVSARVPKSGIKKQTSGDVTHEFSRRLMALQFDATASLAESEYQRLIPLYAEFVKKCPDSKVVTTIQTMHAKLLDELDRIQKGEEKVGGQWFTPVLAALKRFEVMTEKMAELQNDRDYRKSEEMQKLHEQLTIDRREVARSLPGLMQERLPKLLADRQFDSATEEVVGFLHFWLEQVAASEGEFAKVLKGMDVEYIVRMQDDVLDAFKAAGEGKAKPPRGIDREGMVYIPGGYFLMGARDAAPTDDNFPLHLVFVSPFLMDRTEVSNAKYREFVKHVKSSGDSSMEHPDAPPLKKHDAEGWAHESLSRDDQPVVGIDWFDAYAYAKWAGKRLPTEAEWEKAAKGMDDNIFPWGDEIEECGVNWPTGRKFLAKEMDRQNPPLPPEPEPTFGCSCVQDAKPPPPPPTKLPDKTWAVDQHLPTELQEAIDLGFVEWDETYLSPYGVMHMAGNVAEWVYDLYDAGYYAVSPVVDPQGPEEGQGHVFRGGSYQSRNSDELSTVHRGHKGMSRRSVSSRKRREALPYIGMRCARSLDVVKTGQ
ncbi:MAG: SUMF1/EgtB/PvdO family nonheme iron enzyme [Kiritimatiellae bacterium]|nr:SUMF1/EgtB/PvdO family nonheme iron enzyme [Kiritimatiellia bacterium]